MTNPEKLSAAHRLLQSVREHYEPDPMPDLDSSIALVERVRNQLERDEELEREKQYQDAQRYDFPEV